VTQWRISHQKGIANRKQLEKQLQERVHLLFMTGDCFELVHVLLKGSRRKHPTISFWVTGHTKNGEFPDYTNKIIL
jgi:hypothetical protein